MRNLCLHIPNLHLVRNTVGRGTNRIIDKCYKPRCLSPPYKSGYPLDEIFMETTPPHIYGQKSLSKLAIPKLWSYITWCSS